MSYCKLYKPSRGLHELSGGSSNVSISATVQCHVAAETVHEAVCVIQVGSLIGSWTCMFELVCTNGRKSVRLGCDDQHGEVDTSSSVVHSHCGNCELLFQG